MDHVGVDVHKTGALRECMSPARNINLEGHDHRLDEAEGSITSRVASRNGSGREGSRTTSTRELPNHPVARCA